MRKALYEGSAAGGLPAILDIVGAAFQANQKVLVHCRSGKNRSCAVVIACLVVLHGWTLLAAFNAVDTARDCVTPVVSNDSLRAMLKQLVAGEVALPEGWSTERRVVKRGRDASPEVQALEPPQPARTATPRASRKLEFTHFSRQDCGGGGDCFYRVVAAVVHKNSEEFMRVRERLGEAVDARYHGLTVCDEVQDISRATFSKLIIKTNKRRRVNNVR